MTSRAAESLCVSDAPMVISAVTRGGRGKRPRQLILQNILKFINKQSTNRLDGGAFLLQYVRFAWSVLTLMVLAADTCTDIGHDKLVIFICTDDL